MTKIGNLMRISEAQLALYKETPELMEEKVFDDESLEADWFLDIDKAWEGIHYIIAGKSLAESDDEPDVLVRTLFSCQYIDEDQDLGYGPVNYLSPAQVKETNALLQKITAEEAKNRLNLADMEKKQVYPGIWREEDAIDYILDYFSEVQEFYQSAADQNEAVLFYII